MRRWEKVQERNLRLDCTRMLTTCPPKQTQSTRVCPIEERVSVKRRVGSNGADGVYRYNGISTADAYAAHLRVGRLATPEKMPCHSYNLPTTTCRVGSTLRSVKGTVCSKCYGHNRGRYAYPFVRKASERRYAALMADAPNGFVNWVRDMVTCINYYERSGYFRWHDIGDLQSAAHLDAICDVARQTPNVQHWLPTREYKLLRDWRASGNHEPDNLTIRVSGLLIDRECPKVCDFPRGSVVTQWGNAEGVPCTAQSTERATCEDCRLCWNKNVESVQYKLH